MKTRLRSQIALTVLAMTAVACGIDGGSSGSGGPEQTAVNITDPTTSETDPTVPDTEPTIPETNPTVPDTEPAKQTQTIRVTDLNGQQLDFQGETTISTNQTFIEYEPQPIAVETGLPVAVVGAGPAAICQSGTTEPVRILLRGGGGDVCRVELHADGDESHRAADVTINIEFVALTNISWTIESGPAFRDCFEPGDTLPKLEIRGAAGTTSIFGVGVVRSYHNDPSGTRTDSTFGLLSYDEVYQSEGSRLTITFTVDPTVAPGSKIGAVIGYSSPGTGVSTSDAPDEFEWTIENPCP